MIGRALQRHRRSSTSARGSATIQAVYRSLVVAGASLTLSGFITSCSGTSGVATTAPIAHTSSTPTAKPPSTLALPAVGTAGFPAQVFPKAGPGGGGSIPGCPSTEGLRSFSGTAPARAAVIWATVLSQTFSYDLHHTDRAWWSTIRSDWRDARQRGEANPRGAFVGPDAILYTGSLQATPQFGVPRQYRFLRHWCGAALADQSYAIVSGPRNGPALQGVAVFLNRRNHVLLYYEYP